MGFLSKLFGNKKDKLNEYISRDGVIIDVRSKAEYDSGTIPGSKHIPVQNIAAQMEQTCNMRLCQRWTQCYRRSRS